MRATQPSTLFLLSSLASFSNAGLLGRRQLPPGGNLPGVWAYQGCYVDVGRTIDAAATGSGAMTGEACINFCTSKGFQFAGTEYHNECFCGSELAATAAKVADIQCSTACSGDATQACGGPSRLSIYYSSQPVGPQPNPGVNGFNHVGCYTEGTAARALTVGGGVPGAEVSASTCTAACLAKGFVLAGVEYGGECYCGNTLSAGAVPASSGCNVLCNGNPNEICGGASRLNLYNYQNQFPISSTSTSSTSSASSTATSSSSVGSTTVSSASSTVPVAPTIQDTSAAASATPTAPRHPPTVGAYQYYGCQTEATGMRALTGLFRDSDVMDLDFCAAACAGFTYFGVEYGRECYCGNSFNAGSVPAPAADCNFICPGDQWEFCGAGNRLSVYSLNGPASSSSATGSSTATSTASSTSTSAPPTGTGFPAGWSYQGCWTEGAGGRTLPDYQAPDSQTLTQQSCAQLCAGRGFSISGTEYSTQCFCSNAIYNAGAKVADTQCNMACSGNAAQKCGAGGRLTVYSNGPPTVYAAPAPQTGGLGSWAYQGCFRDNINDVRTLFWQLHFPDVMTPKMCLDRCAKYGYAAAGLEYGNECYCGDPQNLITAGAATPRPESECNVVCPGNKTAICGGGSRLTTYFWTGTPFYSWTFPQDPATAGRYDHLIDGVTIPLMTQETITGKVTFLSKWGTGPGNETGAYELDLQLMQFRAMHVKTDIFCAAGVILPDKGGRQLNVGGWSGESTEGVRLYWPDGTPGTWGTRDWQENVNELSLQKGRWYPSAMVMANGSVMVIGGEVGSNGAAVPSIEVLPFTGQEPVYMDWLDRTNPNNLYPFVAVLPQGGIFVAYYNEARILDENTFATIRTLPMIPGAVNDDLAGRTYPLEGTSVLLPQKAPYSEPLGVLICGGSSNGVSNALDNCVSIQPQAADPQWVLERMPSPRVMPCMAPLPDGTIFIANGALHGVAGFGLAVGPNLNSLIYDPEKPVGSRITVAANTTIARMYHSEALTLLDGRVLISGSDPEDGVNPQEYRVEAYSPPYLLSGKPRPTFTITNRDWVYGTNNIAFDLGVASRNGPITVTLLGAVSSTHGNSMGARTIMPAMRCTGTVCSVDAPPNAHVCPPGWYQFFVLDGGIPAVGVYVRIGGDPAGLGNWPPGATFTKPGI